MPVRARMPRAGSRFRREMTRLLYPEHSCTTRDSMSRRRRVSASLSREDLALSRSRESERRFSRTDKSRDDAAITEFGPKCHAYTDMRARTRVIS